MRAGALIVAGVGAVFTVGEIMAKPPAALRVFLAGLAEGFNEREAKEPAEGIITFVAFVDSAAERGGVAVARSVRNERVAVDIASAAVLIGCIDAGFGEALVDTLVTVVVDAVANFSDRAGSHADASVGTKAGSRAGTRAKLIGDFAGLSPEPLVHNTVTVIIFIVADFVRRFLGIAYAPALFGVAGFDAITAVIFAGPLFSGALIGAGTASVEGDAIVLRNSVAVVQGSTRVSPRTTRVGAGGGAEFTGVERYARAAGTLSVYGAGLAEGVSLRKA